MGLDVANGADKKANTGRRFQITEKLYKTKDGRIVPKGDPDANSLFKRAGTSIPMREAIELGLVEKEEPVKDQKAETKQAAKPKNKQAPTAKNKSKGGK